MLYTILHQPNVNKLFTPPIGSGTPRFTPQKLSGLCEGGDNPCTSSFPLTKTFAWTLLEGDYEKAASVVNNRINWNRTKENPIVNCYTGWTVVGGIAVPTSTIDKNCSNLSQVSCIMNSYYTSVMDLFIPEFDPDKLARINTNKTKATIDSETEKIIQYVVKISGQAYFRVKEVLYHLYYATYADSADRLSYQYISPIQYKNNLSKLEKPKDIGSGVTAAGDTASSIFGDVFSWVKWLAILGGVGLAAYIIVPMIATKRG